MHPFRLLLSLAIGFSFLLPVIPAQAKTPSGIDLLESIQDVFVEVAEMVHTGVVSITPTEDAMRQAFSSQHGAPEIPGMPHVPGMPPQGHPPFPPGMPGLPGQPEMPDTSPGSGTGVIIDKSGHVVTNAHVVGDADEMVVSLTDGRRYTAKVVGRDTDTDLAVLKIVLINGDDPLPVLPLGDSDTVKPGQWAIAVGNPFGLDHTVTVGIVSGVGREGVNLTRYENFIQTDAPINPGNSGGPLFNVRGEVIGINTAIMSFAQGIGFAIPINMVRQVSGQLVSHGTVQRGWLGVGIQNIDPELADSFGVKEGAGVLVNEVFADQPAQRSGIQPGDIILTLNGDPVSSPNTLARLIAGLTPESQAELSFLREGVTHTVTTTLGHRDKTPKMAAISPQKMGLPEILGLDIQAITPELAEQLDVDGEGVIVSRVIPGGPAYQQGLREGDVIRELNRQPVPTPEALMDALEARKPGTKVLLRTTRQNAGRYVVLTLNDSE